MRTSLVAGLLWSTVGLVAVVSGVVTATTEATHIVSDEPFSGFTLGAGLVATLAACYYLRYFR